MGPRRADPVPAPERSASARRTGGSAPREAPRFHDDTDGAAGALLVLTAFTGAMPPPLDLAATLSFRPAPALGWLNHRAWWAPRSPPPPGPARGCSR